MLKFC